MKIKGKSNGQAYSFSFQMNLTKGERLKNILEFYEIEEVYLCIYGLNERRIDRDEQKQIEIKKIETIEHSKFSKDIAININASSLPNLFTTIKDNFDELIIWNVYTDWKTFLKQQTQVDSFISFHKASIEDLPACFFLNYSPYEGNCVEIICDAKLSNNVTIDSLRNCLLKSK